MVEPLMTVTSTSMQIYYFPPKLCHVGDFIGLFLKHISIMYAFADRLKTQDLFGAVLGNYTYCIILRRLPNIEILKTSTCIGDEGLDVLYQYCKKLKVLEIRQPSNRDDHDRYSVTDRGMIHVATNCIDLESIIVCMMQLGNRSLLAIAENLKDLRKFDVQMMIWTTSLDVEMSLDVGVRALLSRCEKLVKICLYLITESVSDVGMSYIGEFGSKLMDWLENVKTYKD
ncbi:unnamed protein product [Brassica rapa]|uniref:Uncharacterized protein n=2 Tax=Brassica TaxID=3705 RepID=A0A8D9M6Y6_BRACM|nr:unnamed protein product [Brassica napus]CAG7899155.1 unnamed protein product [Brassica rapa]